MNPNHTKAFFSERNYGRRLQAGYDFMPEDQDVMREPLMPIIRVDTCCTIGSYGPGMYRRPSKRRTFKITTCDGQTAVERSLRLAKFEARRMLLKSGAIPADKEVRGYVFKTRLYWWTADDESVTGNVQNYYQGYTVKATIHEITSPKPEAREPMVGSC